MKPLLEKGVKLAIISGTEIRNIAGGKIAEYFSPAARSGLYLGLGRGRDNYGFDKDGGVIALNGVRPGRRTLALLHGVCFQIHRYLFEHYGYNTDVVFSRGNYCKIDLMPDAARGGSCYFKKEELERVNYRLSESGFTEGIKGLFALARRFGKRGGLDVKPTTDAKYLEVGLGTKSDNVNEILTHMEAVHGVKAEDCCFWGDEYIKMDEGIFGSDAYMITEKTKGGAFFDVSDAEGERPERVTRIGGGVGRFLAFLNEQARG
jgi:hypothetical protein